MPNSPVYIRPLSITAPSSPTNFFKFIFFMILMQKCAEFVQKSNKIFKNYGFKQIKKYFRKTLFIKLKMAEQTKMVCNFLLRSDRLNTDTQPHLSAKIFFKHRNPFFMTKKIQSLRRIVFAIKSKWRKFRKNIQHVFLYNLMKYSQFISKSWKFKMAAESNLVTR
jgi:hypothetical protein